MTATSADLTAAALSLPEPERLALATRLAEPVRRIREVNAGHVETLSTDDVMSTARAAR